MTMGAGGGRASQVTHISGCGGTTWKVLYSISIKGKAHSAKGLRRGQTLPYTWEVGGFSLFAEDTINCKLSILIADVIDIQKHFLSEFIYLCVSTPHFRFSHFRFITL